MYKLDLQGCVCIYLSVVLGQLATITNTQSINESMIASTAPLEKDEMTPDYRDAAFQCEDSALNDDWDLRKGGADLEPTIKAIQSRGEASTAAPILHHRGCQKHSNGVRWNGLS